MFSFPGITQNCIIIEEGNSSIDERRPRQKQYLLKSEAKKNLYDERELISQSTILSFWKTQRTLVYFFLFLFYCILLYNTVLVLAYIDMNLPWVYISSQTWTPRPPPTPHHPSGSSPCTSPKHPVSCIKHRLAIRFLHDSIHVSMPFSQIIPPSPSPSESKGPLYTSVSLLLSCIQGHHYHLSKFHIYVLVYCIGVFLSGLLHSV